MQPPMGIHRAGVLLDHPPDKVAEGDLAVPLQPEDAADAILHLARLPVLDLRPRNLAQVGRRQSVPRVTDERERDESPPVAQLAALLHASGRREGVRPLVDASVWA